MLARTHFVLALFFILFFFLDVQGPVIFFSVFLLASIIPDIDTPFSKVGKIKLFRILNFFTKHRGIIHSLTFMFFISSFFLFFKNSFWLAFVLGYSSHLILDCFTVQGVRLFYPFKLKIKGFVKTNGLIENLLFTFLFLTDLFLIIRLIFRFWG